MDQFNKLSDTKVEGYYNKYQNEHEHYQPDEQQNFNDMRRPLMQHSSQIYRPNVSEMKQTPTSYKFIGSNIDTTKPMASFIRTNQSSIFPSIDQINTRLLSGPIALGKQFHPASFHGPVPTSSSANAISLNHRKFQPKPRQGNPINLNPFTNPEDDVDEEPLERAEEP